MISTVCRFADINCERIAVLGGVQGILNVMAIHTEVVEVQIECMGALQSVIMKMLDPHNETTPRTLRWR